METRGLSTSLRETLDAVRATGARGEPLTTAEVTDQLAVSRRSTYERLERLVEAGALETKKVGARGRVWWRPTDGVDADDARATRDVGTTDGADWSLGAPDETPSNPSETGPSMCIRPVTDHIERERDLELYETIVDATDEGICVLNGEDRFTMANDAYLELTGYDRDRLLGSHARLVADEKTAAESTRRLRAARDTDHPGVTVETDLERADGTTRHVESTLTEIERDDGFYKVAVVRDVTERVERERALEEARRRSETMVANFPNGVVTLVDEDCRYVTVGGTPQDKSGLQPEEMEGTHVGSVLPPKLADLLVPRYEAALEGEASSFEHTLGDSHLQFRIVPIRDDEGDVFAALGMSQDVTERREREQALTARVTQQAAVTRLGQEALEYHDLDDLMTRAARVVAETLDTDYCKVLDLDDDGESLVLRQGVGWRAGIVGAATVSATDDDSQAAYTLSVDEPVVVDDLGTESRFGGPELLTSHDVASGISVTIGSPENPWGILGTHDTEAMQFSEHDVNFVQSVANILAMAIERSRYERQLLRQRERLAAVNSLNEVVRDITDAVIDQSTREQVEAVVCEGLADAPSFAGAWLGEMVGSEGSVRRRTAAGFEGVFDDVTVSVDHGDPHLGGPTGQALVTDELTVCREGHADDPWWDQVDEAGAPSQAAVPVTHADTTYGVLNVYADRPRAFDAVERRVLAQLGEVVGHAIAAVERKQALMSEKVVELEFHVPDIATVADLEDEPAGRLTLDQVVPVGDDEFLLYGTASDDAVADLDTFVAGFPHWESVSELGSWGGRRRYEAQLSDPPVLSVLAARGGHVDRAVIEDGDFHMLVHLPPTVEVRSVTEAVTEAYPTADLLAQRQVSRTGESARRFEHRVQEELTDRQRAALEAAQQAGFFEWPRENDGEAVAESLGVSAPTFHQHLRKAERKVFDALLDTTVAGA